MKANAPSSVVMEKLKDFFQTEEPDHQTLLDLEIGFQRSLTPEKFKSYMSSIFDNKPFDMFIQEERIQFIINNYQNYKNEKV